MVQLELIVVDFQARWKINRSCLELARRIRGCPARMQGRTFHRVGLHGLRRLPDEVSLWVGKMPG
jgi:hypothetical protein